MYSFDQIELQAKLLNYFLGSNKSNINQVGPGKLTVTAHVMLNDFFGGIFWVPMNTV